MEYVTPEGVRFPAGDVEIVTKPSMETGIYYSKVGTKNGKDIFVSNFPPNTPKAVKQQRIIDLVQNTWDKQPITLEIVKDGETIPITAQFNPKLGNRTDLSKLAFGNRKGTARDQRITLNLTDDLYYIAENSQYTKSKKEMGGKNEAHSEAKEWHYFINEIWYREDGIDYPYKMNIDIKETSNGNYFYSFGLEKIK